MQEDRSESGRSAGSGQKQSAGKSGQGHAEARHRYQVRQVTAYQASWMEREKGEEGLFTFQLVLTTASPSTRCRSTATTSKAS